MVSSDIVNEAGEWENEELVRLREFFAQPIPTVTGSFRRDRWFNNLLEAARLALLNPGSLPWDYTEEHLRANGVLHEKEIMTWWLIENSGRCHFNNDISSVLWELTRRDDFRVALTASIEDELAKITPPKGRNLFVINYVWRWLSRVLGQKLFANMERAGQKFEAVSFEARVRDLSHLFRLFDCDNLIVKPMIINQTPMDDELFCNDGWKVQVKHPLHKSRLSLVLTENDHGRLHWSCSGRGATSFSDSLWDLERRLERMLLYPLGVVEVVENTGFFTFG